MPYRASQHVRAVVGAVAALACVVGLRLDAGDLVEDNFTLPVNSLLNDQHVSIAYNPHLNEYFAVWDRGVSPTRDVVGQRFSGSGAPIGSAIPIRTSGSNDEAFPKIAFSETSNTFLVVMQYNQSEILGTLLTETGAIKISGFLVDGKVGGVSSSPDVVWRSTEDNFFIVWVDTADGTGDLFGELRRCWDAAILRDDIVLRDVASGSLAAPDLAYNAALDEYWVSYTTAVILVPLSGEPPPEEYGLFGFAVDGGVTAMATPVKTVSPVTGVQSQPAVAWNSAQNEYLVVFASYRGDSYNVEAQRVQPDGVLIGSSFEVSSDLFPSNERSAEVAYSPQRNRYLVVWNQNAGKDDDFDVFGREVSGTGSTVGPTISISQSPEPTSNESLPHVVYNSSTTQWLVGWQDGRNLAELNPWFQRIAPAPFIASLISVTDAPDPFSPPVDGVDDTTTIEVRYDYQDISQGTRVRTNVSIRAPDGATIGTLTDERPVPTGAGSLTASATWGGENDALQIVPDGTYSYLVDGTLLLPDGSTDAIQPQGTGTVTVQSSVPAFSSLLPSDQSFTNNPRPTVSGLVSDPTGLDATTFRLLQNSVAVKALVKELSPPPTVSFSFTPSEDVPEGIVSLHAEIRNDAGTLGQADWSYVADRTPPTFGTPTPPNKSTIGITQPEIAVPCQDDRSGIDTTGVRIFVNKTDVTSQATVTADAVSFTPPTPLADGDVIVTVTARDRAGNAGTWTWSFTVDSAAPAAPALLSPAEGAFQTTATVTLDWEDSTDASGILNYEVEVDDEPSFTAPTEWAFTVAPSTTAVGMLADGPHFWRVRATDTVGNVSDWSAARSFIVDTTGPALPALLSPDDDALLDTNTPTLDWEDSTDTNGIRDYGVEVDADVSFTDPVEWEATVATSVAATAALGDGRHFWRVRARDNAGNVSGGGAVRSFTVDTTSPAAPTLLAPADAFRVTTSTPTLDWEDSTDASGIESYEVELDADAAFTAPLEWNATVGASATTAAALPEGRHFWRVRARDAAGNLSDWGAVWSFTVDTGAPTVPALLTPADAALVNTATPTLDWSDSADATGIMNYDVEVDSEADFAAPMEWSTTVVPSTTVAASLADGQHFWRVRARDNAGNVSDWSLARGFTIDTVAPTLPGPQAPGDGAYVTTATPTLDWTDSTDANGIQNYDVEVDGDAGFTSPIEWGATVVPSTATTAALAEGQHFWRVRARDNAGNASDWSAVRTFSVDSIAPTVPGLAAPSDGVLLATSTPTLDWSDSTDTNGIQDYEVEVSRDVAFTPPIEWGATVVPSTATTGALADGLHFWRVRARDAAGNPSDWSVVGSFTSDTAAPSVPALLAPADGAFAITSTPLLDWSDSTDASGIRNYDVELDGDDALTAPIEWNATVVPSAATTAALVEGRHFWRARARDNAGNVSDWSAVRSLIVDTTSPTVPALLAPGDGDLLVVSTPTLDWTDSTDANGIQDYDVEVDGDAAFTLPSEWSATPAQSEVVTAALADGQHFWRVRARDAAGNRSDWSVVRGFIIDTGAPTVPTLLAPADAALVNTATPTLDWSNSTDASGILNYDLEVDADTAFTAPLEWNTTVTPSTAATAALADGQHFWRVRARDTAGNLSAWSTARSFTVDTVMPAIPALAVPTDGLFVTTTTPLLDWTDSTDANGIRDYDVDVGSDIAFTPPLEWNATVVPSAATSAVLAQGRHFWRVRARDNAGNVSDWSTVRNFVVDTVAPTVPVLQAPSNGAFLATNAPTLDWGDSTDANRVQDYDVQVDGDGAFAPPIEWSVTVAESSATPTALAEGQHFWRVRARDAVGNASDWSAVRSFTVDTVAPVIADLTPAPDSFQTVARPVLSASFSEGSELDLSSFSLTVDGTDVSSEATVAQTGFTLTPSADLAQGVIVVQVSILDRARNSGEASWQFISDRTGPFFDVIEPPDASSTEELRPTIRAAYSDAVSGIDTSTVRVTVRGGDVTAFATVTPVDVIYVPPDPLVPGLVTVSVTLADRARNQSSRQWSFDALGPATVTLAEGAANPAGRDILQGAAGVPVLQFTLDRGAGGRAIVRTVRVTASGTADDTATYARVRLVLDANADGIAQGGESTVGEGHFSGDDGMLDFAGLDLELVEGVPATFLVVVDVLASATEGTNFAVSIASPSDVTADNDLGQSLVVSGPAVSGGVLQIAAPDTAPPVVTINAPPDGAVFQDPARVTPDFSATDDRGLEWVVGWIDGTTQVQSGVPVDGLTLGTHTLAVTASDRAGNQTTAGVTFYVESVEVVYGPSHPAPGSVPAGSQDVVVLQFRVVRQGAPGTESVVGIILGASGTIDDSTLGDVSLIEDLDSNGVAGPQERVLATGRFTGDDGMLALGNFASAVPGNGGTTYLLLVDLTGAQPFGSNFAALLGDVAVAVGGDVIGPLGLPLPSRTIQVDDLTGPVITIDSPPDRAVLQSLGPLVLDFTATDEQGGSGVDSILADLDGVDVTDGQTIELATLSIGSHTLTVVATDRAGNRRRASSTFTVEAQQQTLQTIADRIQAVIDDQSTPPDAAPALQGAIDLLVGNNDGRAGNGALQLMNQGNIVAAYVKIQQAIRKLGEVPGNVEAARELQRALAEFVRDVQTARVTHLEELIPDPEPPEMDRIREYMALGNAAFDAGNYQEAVQNYRMAEQRILELDQEAPNVVFVEPRGMRTNDTTPTIIIDYTDILGLVRPTQIQLFFNGFEVTGSAQIGPYELVYAVSTPLAEGSYPVRTLVPDAAGNVADITRDLVIDVTPPRVLSVTPADGATGVAQDATVTVVFSEPVRAPEMAQLVELLDPLNTQVPGVVTQANGGAQAVLRPDAVLGLTSIYRVRVPRAGGTVTDLAGNALDPPTYSSAFRTVSFVPPTTPTLTRPMAGMKTSDNTVIVEGIAQGLIGIEVLSDGAVVATTQTNLAGEFRVETPALPDGAHDIAARATDCGMNSPPSASRSIVVDTTPPAAPSGVSIIEADGYTQLRWNPNQEPDLRGYLVFRKGPGDVDFLLVTPLVLRSTAFRDTNVTNGQTYQYKVRAVDDALPDSP